MKFFEWFIRIIYWLQAFVSLVIVFGLIGLIFYLKSGNDTIEIIFLSTGALLGIIVAEYIRRKYGLENFFSRIYGPNEMDEKIRKDAEK